jgi:serine/threonine protein kinase
MYGAGMDVWGAGCILFELTTLYPLFPGADEVDQINRIHRVLGTPSETAVAKLKEHASAQANFSFKKQSGIGLSKLLPGVKEHCLDLLTQTVEYDAAKRITSQRAIQHPYFVGDMPLKSRIQGTKETLQASRPESLTTSSTIASNPVTEEKTSSGQSTSEDKPVTKTKSMVSILLARVRQQRDIIVC